MIKRKDEMNETIRVNMRGGDGHVKITNFLDKGEYDGHARLLATITLEPGCSIGKHIHENEEEIFLILSGTAVYDDDGTEVTLFPGDSCICRNGQSHSIANRNEQGDTVVAAIILTL